jgi:hypothetical protein
MGSLLLGEQHNAAIHIHQHDLERADAVQIEDRRGHRWRQVAGLDHHQEQDAEPNWIEAEHLHRRHRDRIDDWDDRDRVEHEAREEGQEEDQDQRRPVAQIGRLDRHPPNPHKIRQSRMSHDVVKIAPPK